MRVRSAPILLLIALAATACSPSPSGPVGPVAPDQVTPDDAVKATGARTAAAAFVRAYADDTGADPKQLAALVDGDRLRRWVHWLGVQDREFPGTISGAVDGNQIGPAVPFDLSSVPGSDAFLRDVDVQASVTFSFQPDQGDTITLTRSLDGPMRLLFDDAQGTWRVLDFTRDGLPLSQTFEIVKGGTDTSGGVDVTIDSFVSVPYWQFFLRVSSSSPVALARRDVRLLDADGHQVATAREVSGSLSEPTTDAHPTEGIVTFPAQATENGLTLQLTFRGTRGPTSITFKLRDLIHPIPPATTSPSPSP